MELNKKSAILTDRTFDIIPSCNYGVRVSHRLWKLLLAIINPIGRFIEAYALLLEAYVPPSTFADR